MTLKVYYLEFFVFPNTNSTRATQLGISVSCIKFYVASQRSRPYVQRYGHFNIWHHVLLSGLTNNTCTPSNTTFVSKQGLFADLFTNTICVRQCTITICRHGLFLIFYFLWCPVWNVHSIDTDMQTTIFQALLTNN